jgi:hypothetical protein
LNYKTDLDSVQNRLEAFKSVQLPTLKSQIEAHEALGSLGRKASYTAWEIYWRALAGRR